MAILAEAMANSDGADVVARDPISLRGKRKKSTTGYAESFETLGGKRSPVGDDVDDWL